MGCCCCCFGGKKRKKYTPLKPRTRKGLTLKEHKQKIILQEKQKSGHISQQDLALLVALTKRYRGKPVGGLDDDGSKISSLPLSSALMILTPLLLFSFLRTVMRCPCHHIYVLSIPAAPCLPRHFQVSW